MQTVLNQLVASGVTIFLTSHILEIVEKLCIHVAIIHRGRLVAHGPSRTEAGAPEAEQQARSLEELFLFLVEGDRWSRGACRGSS